MGRAAGVIDVTTGGGAIAGEREMIGPGAAGTGTAREMIGAGR